MFPSNQTSVRIGCPRCATWRMKTSQWRWWMPVPKWTCWWHGKNGSNGNIGVEQRPWKSPIFTGNPSPTPIRNGWVDVSWGMVCGIKWQFRVGNNGMDRYVIKIWFLYSLVCLKWQFQWQFQWQFRRAVASWTSCTHVFCCEESAKSSNIGESLPLPPWKNGTVSYYLFGDAHSYSSCLLWQVRGFSITLCALVARWGKRAHRDTFGPNHQALDK